ncbi:MAG: ribosome maturation factor RimM [Pseudomonadota bacterium]
MTPGAPATPPVDLIEVGRVVDAWGVKGWLRIEPLNAPEESVLLKVRDWWLQGRSETEPRPIRVSRCRVHGDGLVAKPSGFEDRDQALSLRSAAIRVSRAAFPPLETGEVYWVDLIGCEVRNARDEPLGTVQKIEDHGAHPILFVEASDRILLIPMVDPIVSAVDLKLRQIRADWELDY